MTPDETTLLYTNRVLAQFQFPPLTPEEFAAMQTLADLVTSDDRREPCA